MKHRISPAVVLSALALFFSLGGVGIAASGYRITSIFQIKPKVRAELRGQQGPDGLTGLTGLVGPHGVQGASGVQASAVNGVEYAQGQQITIAPGDHGSSIAACGPPPGYYVWAVIGSYEGSPGVQVFSNGATNGFGSWITAATNPTTQPIELRTTVACLISASPKLLP